MKLYDELASWFHLLTAPASYAREAELYTRLITERASGPVVEVLELGCGGGNNASHMKASFRLTLVDVSPAMLAVSRRLNPECEHLQGDMRTLQLGRRFDAVFVHDAVMYMTTEEDLRAVMASAAAHCRPGGVVLFAPDCVAETYRDFERDGGHDGADGRSLRYHETTSDPDPNDSSYRVDFTIRLRDSDGATRTETETHFFGLFRKQEWVDWLAEAGLDVECLPMDLGGPEAPPSFVFVGVMPARRP